MFCVFLLSFSISYTPSPRRPANAKQQQQQSPRSLAPTRRSAGLVSWLEQTRRLRKPARKTTKNTKNNDPGGKTAPQRSEPAACAVPHSHHKHTRHTARSNFTLRSLPDRFMASLCFFFFFFLYVRVFVNARARAFVCMPGRCLQTARNCGVTARERSAESQHCKPLAQPGAALRVSPASSAASRQRAS